MGFSQENQIKASVFWGTVFWKEKMLKVLESIYNHDIKKISKKIIKNT